MAIGYVVGGQYECMCKFKIKQKMFYLIYCFRSKFGVSYIGKI